MSTDCLVIGESGTGKSTSIRNLDPKETFLVNVINKPLPFPKAKGKYVAKQGGNLHVTDDSEEIGKVFNEVSANRHNIKTIIVDDFQYIIGK